MENQNSTIENVQSPITEIKNNSNGTPSLTEAVASKKRGRKLKYKTKEEIAHVMNEPNKKMYHNVYKNKQKADRFMARLLKVIKDGLVDKMTILQAII